MKEWHELASDPGEIVKSVEFWIESKRYRVDIIRRVDDVVDELLYSASISVEVETAYGVAFFVCWDDWSTGATDVDEAIAATILYVKRRRH